MKRDQLDHAIDHVAARLTHVTDDEGLALRIATALPDRSGWTPFMWVSRFAMGALATVAIATTYVVLQPFDERSTPVLRSAVLSSPTVELAARATVAEHRTDVEPAQIVRRTVVERSQNDRRTIEDFDRSLAAVAAPDALILESLSPEDLPAEDALAIAPLAIADLALTAESFPPR
jgi:hypothetical protein